MTHAIVKPVRLRSHSEEWGVDVSKIVGYRAQWPSGEKGPVRAMMRAARLDLRAAVKVGDAA